MTESVTTGMNAPSSTKPVSAPIIHCLASSSQRSMSSTRLMPTINTSSGASACQSTSGLIQSDPWARIEAIT